MLILLCALSALLWLMRISPTPFLLMTPLPLKALTMVHADPVVA